MFGRSSIKNKRLAKCVEFLFNVEKMFDLKWFFICRIIHEIICVVYTDKLSVLLIFLLLFVVRRAIHLSSP